MTLESKLRRIQEQAANGDYKLSSHAEREMKAENISEDDVREAIASSQILEDYPTHQRGACCILGGITKGDRQVHIVCTTAQSPLIIITVYEPLPPGWVTPTQRRSKS